MAAQLEAAVLTLFAGPTHEAQAYCDAVKQSPESWRLCWEVFLSSARLEARFWCLQVLVEKTTHSGAVGHVRPEDVVVLRQEAVRFACHGAESLPDPSLKNKLAVLVTRLVQCDYPVRWPTAFRELGSAPPDFFLRFLATLDQEVFSEEAGPREAQERQKSNDMKASWAGELGEN